MEYKVIDGSTEEAEFKIVVTELENYCAKYELSPVGIDYADEILLFNHLKESND